MVSEGRGLRKHQGVLASKNVIVERIFYERRLVKQCREAVVHCESLGYVVKLIIKTVLKRI